MPLMLDDEAARRWVTASSGEDVKDLISSYPADRMSSRAVNTYVNSIKNEGEQCWSAPAPTSAKPKKPEQLDLFG